MLEYDKIDINEGIDINKNILTINVICVVIGIGMLLIKSLIIKNTCVMVVTIYC